MKEEGFFDPTIPTFHYTEAEREEMKRRNPGMTDADIDEKEARASHGIAKEQVEREQRAA